MGHSSLVHIVASWELCWYRYEVDLSDEVPVVRVAAQGYELDELTPEERQPNASYDEHGALTPHEFAPLARQSRLTRGSSLDKGSMAELRIGPLASGA
jgi:hypothetical protein